MSCSVRSARAAPTPNADSSGSTASPAPARRMRRRDSELSLVRSAFISSSIPIDVPRQDFPLADPVRCAHHAFLFHPLDDPRGAVIADLQIALHETRGRLAFAAHQRNRLIVEPVV